MSDESERSPEPIEATIPYEPPRITPLGNVRDLLAGNFGSQPDGSPVDPDNPTKAPG
jgi:hypothetical protein